MSRQRSTTSATARRRSGPRRAGCGSTLVNRGRLAHTFRLERGEDTIVAKVSSLLPGDRASKTVRVRKGEYRFFCALSNHEELGHVRHPGRQVRTVEPERFRAVMGHFATGVAVVTVDTPDGPLGMTANAVASLSLDPVLVLVCFDNGARTLPEVERAGRFGVNVLAAGQEHLARRFASKERRRSSPRSRTACTTASPCSTARSPGSAASSSASCPAAITRSASARSTPPSSAPTRHEPLIWFRGGYGAIR